jgi:transposase-like protein
MTSTKPGVTNDKPSSRTERKKTPTALYSAADKVQAVLAVWTERCKPADVCRQMNINWMTFHHWQRRAMEGMLQALENRVNLAKGEALSPRLQALLLHHQRTSSLARLSSRLEQVQQSKIALTPAEAAKTG